MAEFKKILCAVDFSEFSRRALDHAMAVARWHGSSVTALHVTSPAPLIELGGAPYFPAEIPLPVSLPVPDAKGIGDRLRDLAEAERIPGVTVATLVTEAADISREILAQAAQLESDLVVVGTHGRSGFQRLFLGSVTEKVLRQATCPVLTVPPGTPDAMHRGPAPFEHILCATDFSDSSSVVIEHALSLAVRSHAALTVAHVIDARPLYFDFSPPAVIDLDAWTTEARERLRQLVPPAARDSCTVSEVVREGIAHSEIVRLAAEVAADLIVLGVRGRSAVNLLAFGSTTHHVIREAQCAVLTVRYK